MSAHAGVASSVRQGRTSWAIWSVVQNHFCRRRHCHAGANLAAQDREHRRVTAQAARLSAGIPALRCAVGTVA
jgi:hypothetical protein